MMRKKSHEICMNFIVHFLILIFTIPSSLGERVVVSPVVLQRLKRVLSQSECYFFIEFFMEKATPKDKRDWAWDRMEEFGLWPNPTNCSPALDAWSQDLFPPLIHDDVEDDKRTQASELLDRALRYAAHADVEEWEKLYPNILSGESELSESKQLGHEKMVPLPVDIQTLPPPYYSPEIESRELHDRAHGSSHVIPKMDDENENKHTLDFNHEPQSQSYYSNFKLNREYDHEKTVPKLPVDIQSLSPPYYSPEFEPPTLHGLAPAHSTGHEIRKMGYESDNTRILDFNHDPRPESDDYNLKNKLRHMNDQNDLDLPYEDIEEVFRRKAEEENALRLNHEAQALRHVELLKSDKTSSVGQIQRVNLETQLLLMLSLAQFLLYTFGLLLII